MSGFFFSNKDSKKTLLPDVDMKLGKVPKLQKTLPSLGGLFEDEDLSPLLNELADKISDTNLFGI